MSNEDGEDFDDLSLDQQILGEGSRQNLISMSGGARDREDEEDEEEQDRLIYNDRQLKQMIENYSLSAHDLSDCSLRDQEDAEPERGKVR